MPVRQLEIFLNERRATASESLQSLSGIRLGIDASSWLRTILLSPKGKEPYATALGSTVPFHLHTIIKNELDQFNRLNIQPFFVFSGMTFRREHTISLDDTRPLKRHNAWEQYEKGQVNSALITWTSCGSSIVDMVPYVMSLMTELNIEFMRAPYSSSAQLSYMLNHPQQLLHAVYGSVDLLMFDIDRAITAIDVEKGTFSWIDKPLLLHNLGISDDQFLDSCILAGFEYIPTFMPFSAVENFSWVYILDMVRRFGSGFTMSQQMLDPQEQHRYLESYCKVRAAIKFHIVLQTDGRIEPLNVDYAPSDLHEVFGPRLPNQLYQDLAVGLISPQVLNAIVSGHLLEFAPLCNGETIEYEKILTDLLPIRSQALNLIMNPLHTSVTAKSIQAFLWFESTVEHPLDQEKLAMNEKLQWHVTNSFIDDELKSQSTQRVDWMFCLRATMKENKAAKTLTPKKDAAHPSIKLSSNRELLANTLWSILELRGFLDAKHHHMHLGRTLLQAATRPSEVNATLLYDELFLAIELLKAGMLHGKPFSRVYHSNYLLNYILYTNIDKEKSNITLITRVASLLTPAYSGKTWGGPVDRDILSFSSIVRVVNKTLRSLTESVACAFHLSAETNTERIDFCQLANSLPFGKDTSACSGILVKAYLDEVNRNKTSNEAVLQMLTTTFPVLEDIKGQLRRIWHFWDQLMFAVKRLKSDGIITEDVSSQFKQADEWLASKIS